MNKSTVYEDIKSGSRVNLSEIQYLLMQHPDIKNSIVKVDSNNKSKKRIIAFIETNNTTLDFKKLRDYLSSFLPSYMLPNKVVRKTSLPLSFNGKLSTEVH